MYKGVVTYALSASAFATPTFINLAHLRNQKTRMWPVDGHSVLGSKLKDNLTRGLDLLQSTIFSWEAPARNGLTNSSE